MASSLPITLLSPVTVTSNPATTSLPVNFGALLGQAVQGLQNGQATADSTIQQAMTGHVSVTQAMVAMTAAQMQLDVATAVQSQAVSAYQTVMNMPLG
jgi:flagellar hook-basal body complex protein FliE